MIMFKSSKMDFVWRWRVFDYITCAVLGLVGAVVGILVRPHCRSFVFEDTSINHPPSATETFPTYSVVIATFLVVFIYAAGEYFTWREHGKHMVAKHLNAWILVQFFSLSLDYCIVNLCKLYAGRLRPDFIHRLAREGVTESNFHQFTHDKICGTAREGRLSFPSGHTSSTFAGFVPLVLYLLCRTRTFRTGAFYTAAACLLPLSFPLIASISRTRDNKHHFSDIVGGAIVGTFSALFSVFLSFVLGPTGDWVIRSESFNTPSAAPALGSMTQNPIEENELRIMCTVNSANGEG
ncbi:phosphatidic acid phosphatase, putative [Trypanosoma cruzi marinkellei]|uniref:Phosphatidic acid phosphatase, putative n=1 Tax=Trypanosoma cruzi marinkellei TaxID=85056 RepID=K2NQU9_TRYCR|nr:phosphatidic acid phosphatase, putative [Trypanosoma cruzi marinkellei]